MKTQKTFFHRGYDYIVRQTQRVENLLGALTPVATLHAGGRVWDFNVTFVPEGVILSQLGKPFYLILNPHVSVEV